MSLVTGSDHNLVWLFLNLGEILRFKTKRRKEETIYKRRIFLYNKATNENWEGYKSMLERLLRHTEEGQEKVIGKEEKEREVNERWDQIESAILKAANRHIPSKWVKNIREEVNKNVDRSPIFKDSRNLRRIARKAIKSIGEIADQVDRLLFDCQIQSINERNNSQVPLTSMVWEKEWFDEVKNWIKILEKRANLEEQKRKEKCIVENIEKRYGLIGKNDKLMLNSILERPWRKILIDKVLKREGSNHSVGELISEPYKIKKEVKEFYQGHFKKRKHNFERMSKDWIEEYEPKHWIDPTWYEEVEQPIQEPEWIECIKDAKANTAPGLSGISYTFIKRAGPVATAAFLRLSNLVLDCGIMPRKWKVGQIFPIPKLVEWDYALASTRPIMLLETFRKTLVRIVQRRLSLVLTQHRILKGQNYAGLPGEATSIPIHIFNNLVEEAREKKKEVWVLFQDIKKAFDSVPSESIQRALRRIKVPEKTSHFITELYARREVRVITKFGVTEGFEAEDGIDQGEVISPLVWKVIYDPLLCKIQSLEEGYKMEVNWPIDINKGLVRQEKAKINCLAYADDTTFIGGSKKDLETITKVANEYYEINDIKTNPTKSELLVLHKKNKEEEASIKLGSDRELVKMDAKRKAIRFLGVWVTEKNQARDCKKRIQKDVASFTAILRYKKLSIGQIKYLNNMVLLPRIEYKAMTNLLRRSVCEAIHQPMMRLAKWKAQLVSTAPNCLVANPDFIGMKTFWDRHTEHAITEWSVRINDSGLLGKTTMLRLKEAQLEHCNPSPIWCFEESEFNEANMKFNLNAKVMQLAKSLGFEVISETHIKEWQIGEAEGSGTKIIKVLQEANWKGSLTSLKKLRLWYIEQLVDPEGNSLLTWQQIKKLRKESTKGRKASWFAEIEKIMIENNTRTLLEPIIDSEQEFNQFLLEPEIKKVSRKRSRKEWVLFDSDKENSPKVGRIVKKTKDIAEVGSMLVIEKSQKENARVAYRNSKETPPEKVKEKERVKLNKLVDISQWIEGKENAKVGLNLGHYKRPLERRAQKVDQKEVKEVRKIKKEITAKRWEEICIENTVKGRNKVEELVQILDCNWRDRTFSFYTDGSVRMHPTLGRLELGYSVVQVDKNGKVVRGTYGGMQGWASSTRAELMGIVEALLIVPNDSEVMFNTDSQMAINLIKTALRIQRTREWLKLNNPGILSAIREMVVTKRLKVEFNKIQAHSQNKLNQQADTLAKRGRKEGKLVDIHAVSTRGFFLKPTWHMKTVETPLREMIKKLLGVTHKAEWTFLRGRNDEVHVERNSETDWLVFKKVLTQLRKAQGRSIRDNQVWSFRLKSFNRLLPTLEKRRCFRPDLYEDNLCKKCNTTKETFEHLTACDSDTQRWAQAEEEMVKKAWESLDDTEKRVVSREQLGKILRGTCESGDTEKVRRNKLARGIIHKETRKRLYDQGISNNRITKLLVQFMQDWLQFFQDEVWNSRCKSVLEWEKEVGVRKREKYEKKKRKSKEQNERSSQEGGEKERRRSSHPKKQEEWSRSFEIATREVYTWMVEGINSPWCRN